MDQTTVDTGALRFTGGRRAASHWAKLASNTEPKQLTRLLQNYWSASLPEPQALFSVVGGSVPEKEAKRAGRPADFVELPPHTALEVARGISRAAQATGAWVLTGAVSVGSAATLLGNDLAMQGTAGVLVTAATWFALRRNRAQSTTRL